MIILNNIYFLCSEIIEEFSLEPSCSHTHRPTGTMEVLSKPSSSHTYTSTMDDSSQLSHFGSSVLGTVQEMFPALPRSVIQNALVVAGGDVNKAIESLLPDKGNSAKFNE